MPLWIQIAPGSNDPIYVQITSQVGRAIAAGELAVGDKLPPIRDLATEFDVPPGSIATGSSVAHAAALMVPSPPAAITRS